MIEQEIAKTQAELKSAQLELEQALELRRERPSLAELAELRADTRAREAQRLRRAGVVGGVPAGQIRTRSIGRGRR